MDIIKEYRELMKNHTEYKGMIEASVDFLDYNLRTSPLEVLEIANSLLPLVKSEKDYKSLGIINVLIGWTHIDLGQYEKAREAIEESLKVFMDIEHNFGIIRAYNALGYLATKIGDMGEALLIFNKAIEIALLGNDKAGLALLYGNVGETFQKLGEYQEAINYFKKSSEFNLNQANWALCLEGIGTSYYHLGEYEKALPFLYEALKIAEEDELMLVKSHALSSLSLVYEKLNQLDKAIATIYKAKKLAQEANLPRYVGDSYLALGAIYLKKNEKGIARDYFKKAHAKGKEVNDISLRFNALKHLSDLSKDLKDWENAYIYYVEYYQEAEKLASDKADKEIQKLKINEAKREIELLTRMHQQVAFISQMGQEITSSLDLEKVIFTIYDLLEKLMDIMMFGIGLYDEKNKAIEMQFAITNKERFEPKTISLDRDDSFIVKSFVDKKAIIINDIEAEYESYVKKISPFAPLKKWTAHSMVYLPLEVNNLIIGVITVQSLKKNAFDEYKIEMIKALSSYIAIAVENSKLYEKVQKMATFDTVTQLYNRAHFIHLGEKEFLKFKRKGPAFSLIMFDLDFFKEINDQYGHDVGDSTLRQVAYECKKRLRESDLFCRYGGDEFMILLPMTNQDEAKIVAESLVQTVRSIKINTERGESFSITASFGLASVEEEDFSLKELLKKVDLALYQAKNKGRDRLESYLNN